MKPAVIGAVLGVALGAAVAFTSCTTDRPSESFKCSGQADCSPGRVCTEGYCVVGTLPADARQLDAAVCPAICQGQCDFQSGTCTITGTGSGNITCPTGWRCDINCNAPGACGTITCSSADRCNIVCNADNACLSINCGGTDCTAACTGTNACGNIACSSGDCTATCTGTNACGNISCSSGDCRETCSGGANACGTLTCGTGRCDAICQGAGPACGAVSCASSCDCDVACDSTTNPCPAVMNCPSQGMNACTTTGMVGGRCDSSVAPQCSGC